MRNEFTEEDLKKLEGSGTLLNGVFRPAFFDLLKERNPKKVFVMEGRPSLESAKETSKELLKRGITPTIIADNMAGFLFHKNLLKEVWIAFIDIDSHGALCQIGSSVVGLLAKEHSIEVYCYPSKYLRKDYPSVGASKDLINFNGKRIATKNTEAYVPLVEWIPGRNFFVKEGQDKNPVGNADPRPVEN